MARLLRGEDPKIDRINDLVDNIMKNPQDSDSMEKLLKLFNPMILGVCKKWSTYFNDDSHRMISFSELVSDAQSWFAQYTITKYIVDGRATYNKFITDHVNQRVRYIYECELKYYKNNIFPDPDKNESIDDDSDALEYVAYNYKSEHDNMEEDIIGDMNGDSRVELAHVILSLLDNEATFNHREREIFTSIIYNGVTHEKMGENLGISRARVSQILRKVKNKLYKQIEENQAVWELIGDTEIEFKER